MRVLWVSLGPKCFIRRGPNLPVPALRIIWTGNHPAQTIQAKIARKKEASKTMGRRQLTTKEMLKGVRKALSSSKTPPQLKAGLRKRAEWLKDQIAQRKTKSELSVCFRRAE